MDTIRSFVSIHLLVSTSPVRTMAAFVPTTSFKGTAVNRSNRAICSRQVRPETAMPTRVVPNTPRRSIVMEKEAWVPLIETSEISPGELKGVVAAGQAILVSCDYDGQVYACSNVCPHLGTPLTDGSIADGVLTCTQHKSSFDLSSGDPVGSWCPFPPLIGPLLGLLQGARPLPVYAVRETDGTIEALLNVEAREDFEKNYWQGILDSKGKATGEYY